MGVSQSAAHPDDQAEICTFWLIDSSEMICVVLQVFEGLDDYRLTLCTTVNKLWKQIALSKDLWEVCAPAAHSAVSLLAASVCSCSQRSCVRSTNWSRSFPSCIEPYLGGDAGHGNCLCKKRGALWQHNISLCTRLQRLIMELVFSRTSGDELMP